MFLEIYEKFRWALWYAESKNLFHLNYHSRSFDVSKFWCFGPRTFETRSKLCFENVAMFSTLSNRLSFLISRIVCILSLLRFKTAYWLVNKSRIMDKVIITIIFFEIGEKRSLFGVSVCIAKFRMYYLCNSLIIHCESNWDHSVSIRSKESFWRSNDTVEVQKDNWPNKSTMVEYESTFFVLVILERILLHSVWVLFLDKKSIF